MSTKSPPNLVAAAIPPLPAPALPASPFRLSAKSSRPSKRPSTPAIKLPMQEFSALDGAILIDKPAGPTSHDVVDAIRRHFQIKKVGHCGTLDPNATGLLIIVLGRGTKLSEKLMSTDKVYEGTLSSEKRPTAMTRML